MEYFLGSVKLMLIVYALSACIAMAAAWVMKMIFAVIRRQQTPAPGASAPADSRPGKAA